MTNLLRVYKDGRVWRWQCACGRTQFWWTQPLALHFGLKHIRTHARRQAMSYVPQHAAVADPKRPWKAIAPLVVAFLYAVVEGAQVAFSDHVWDTNDTFTVVLIGLGALMTYVVPNPIVSKPTPEVDPHLP